MRPSSLFPVAGLLVSSLLSCHRSGAPKDAPKAAAVPAASAVQVAAGAGRRTEVGKAQEQLKIPAGRFYAGSLPGDEGRDPTLEPVLASYDMPAFTMDALPYPGVPGEAPLTGVSQAEAQKKCAERGARLCTELEWERACRGPAGDAFAVGPAYDPTCEKTPEKCVSGFGARAMGTTLEEWTSSGAVDPVKGGKKVAVKGAFSAAPAAAHRCAARRALDPTVSSKMVGFRCCAGPESPAAVPAVEAQPTFRKASLDRLTDVFAGVPELARVKQMPRWFKETEIQEIVDKAKNPPGAGWVLTVDPIEWSPVPGTDLLVITGRSKGGAFIVAFHKLPGDKLRLASSMLFVNEPGPIVLGYQPAIKREINWSMAWGSAGEGGAITYRDDHRVVIVQR